MPSSRPASTICLVRGDILRRRRRVTAGMIVGDDQGGGIATNRIAENLADAQMGAVERSLADRRIGDDVVAGVDKHDLDKFLVGIGHFRRQQSATSAGDVTFIRSRGMALMIRLPSSLAAKIWLALASPMPRNVCSSSIEACAKPLRSLPY